MRLCLFGALILHCCGALALHADTSLRGSATSIPNLASIEESDLDHPADTNNVDDIDFAGTRFGSSWAFRCFGTRAEAADGSVECVDPRDAKQCTPGASKRAAITFTFDQYIPWHFNETWYKSARKGADMNHADLVLLLPANYARLSDRLHEGSCSMLSRIRGLCKPMKHKFPIPADEREVIKKYFKVVRTPWVEPIGLSNSIPRKGGCCGAREFMKLNALGLDEYDAVINLDTDVTILGSIRELFDCAASGHFLTARGWTTPTQGSMFVAKPSRSLLYDIIVDLKYSRASIKSGWNGVVPSLDAAQGTYGLDGLQGFLYYFFYQKKGAKDLRPGQVDPCVWTGAGFCKGEYDKPLACEAPLRHKIKCGDGRD